MFLMLHSNTDDHKRHFENTGEQLWPDPELWKYLTQHPDPTSQLGVMIHPFSADSFI